MKRKLFVIIFIVTQLFLGLSLSAQVIISTDNSQADPSAMFDVKSTNKGMLIPRMTFEQRNAIVNPAEGLMIMCTNCTAIGTPAISIFVSGYWQNLYQSCVIPNSPFESTHISEVNQITWKWKKTPISTGYKWNTIDNYYSAIDVGTDTNYIETGLTCVTFYTRYVWAYNNCGHSNSVALYQTTSSSPFPAPTAGIHIPTLYQIVWNWNQVAGANGYKWNSVNDYNTAVDMGTATSKTEPGVNCGTLITRYIWAYNTCGISNAMMLTQMATACPANCMPITDARDGKVYNTVLIGTQCWMKENLNIGAEINSSADQSNNSTIEKYCYDNLESNCSIYGGLYQWAEMVQYLNGATNTTSWNPVPTGNVTGLCPTGWHLPTDAEWTNLATFLGGISVAGGKMKESGTTHWYAPNTGATNSIGFNAVPGGLRGCCSSGLFNFLGSYAWFWSSSEYSPIYPWVRNLYYDNVSVTRSYNEKTYGLSCRCVQN